MIKRKLAFTLAETLIVMGIIGVVAALTLPNLNSSTGEKEKVAKVKKIYSNLQDAYGRATAIYGPLDEWFNSDTNNLMYSKRAGERITEFMKISKSCANNTTAGCVTDASVKAITGGSTGVKLANGDMYTYILADGTSFIVDGTNAKDNNKIIFVVDIDGPSKGKFTHGYDVFFFSANSTGVFPDIGGGYESPLNCKVTTRLGCTAWVIYNNNMDYLKIDNSGKCPNGTTILNWTTNTTCK